MRDNSDRHPIETLPMLTSPKRLGSYLLDAGLLNPDQINVALNDQKATGMRFGEVLVVRGWLKEQTVEWVMKRVVEPERRQHDRQKTMQPSVPRPHSLDVLRTAVDRQTEPAASSTSDVAEASKKPAVRREVPISKPLPSVKSSDNDVNWVG
jgi:hypothetical protein